MSLYEKLNATADRLLESFGQEINIETKGNSDPDPVTGLGGSTVATTFTVNGLLLPYPDRLIDGTRIQVGDRQLIVSAATTYAPAVSDRPVVGGKTWAVVGVDTVSPAGTDVVYKLQVRQ